MSSPQPLNLDNIQGDILSGLPKKTETYLFFQITNADQFRHQLTQIVPLIKSVAQVEKDRKSIEEHKRRGRPGLIQMVGVNISFSHLGFVKMGINDDGLTIDKPFASGQLADAANLGDKGTGTGADFVPDWEPAFKQPIHGMILVAGDSHATANKKMAEIEKIFGLNTAKSSIKEVTRIVGDVRPGKEHAHEHFGFLDGISNPSVIGFDKNPRPGPKPVRAGALITGQDGDEGIASRPPWAVDGSYLALRYLFQLVPEFDDFLEKNPAPVPGLTAKEGSELMGARLVGRWKSGAPIDLSPFDDDKELAADPDRNNNFHYSAERDFQKICPFAAHTRKTNPRADLEDATPPISIEKNRIIRRGIQFGPEVTQQEKRDRKTGHGRGLIFVSYQSSITNGFQFIQKSWANNANFPPFETTPETPGLDPIIGQGNRKLSGTDPNKPSAEVTLPDFVVSRGGEYFFSPSLKGLKETLAIA